MSDRFITLLLNLHIACGSIALLIGLVLLGRTKGDPTHKKFGKCFFLCMSSSAWIGMILSCMRPQMLLTIIAVFTLYLVHSGKRCMKWPQLDKPSIEDYLLGAFGVLAGVALCLIGLQILFSHEKQMAYVLLIFAAICILMSYQQVSVLKDFKRGKKKYLPMHIQRMVGSYIAAFTAFLVVNNRLLHGWLAWMLPTVLLVPWIVHWSKKYVQDAE